MPYLPARLTVPQLAPLEEKLSMVIVELRRSKNAARPVNRIPRETLANVFLFLLSEVPPHPHTGVRDRTTVSRADRVCDTRVPPLARNGTHVPFVVVDYRRYAAGGR